MQINNNIYGLSTSRNDTDSHMIKNMEWGALVYLSNSNYGLCSNNTCSIMTKNSDSNYTTGGNDYVSNVNQSSTGNIYGVYDMYTKGNEFVMGNVTTNIGSYVYNAASGGSNFIYNGNEKYIDTYASSSDSSHFNVDFGRSRLGDAMGEIIIYDEGSTSSWYYLGARISFGASSNSIGWIIRNYSGFSNSNGDSTASYYTRGVLVSMTD